MAKSPTPPCRGAYGRGVACVVLLVTCTGRRAVVKLEEEPPAPTGRPAPAISTTGAAPSLSMPLPKAPREAHRAVGDAAIENARALHRCPALPDWLPSKQDLEDGMTDLSASVSGDFVDLSISWHGNGVFHEEPAFCAVVHVPMCAALTMETASWFEAWTSWHWFDAVNAPGPTRNERTWLAGRCDDGAPFRAGDPRHGPGLLKASQRPRPESEEIAQSFRLSGRLSPSQPEYAGRPLAGEAVYFDDEVRRSLGFPALLPDEGRPSPEGVSVGRTDSPTVRLKAGDVSVYEAPVRVRQRGAIVALYRRSTNRHRWACILEPGRPTWVGSSAGMAFAWTRTEHPVFTPGEAVFVIDLQTGSCHALDVPLASTEVDDVEHRFTAVRLDRDAIEIRSGEEKVRVPLAEIRARM